jgi:CTP:molybdopterin cytidylyltransferase MocA
MSIAAVILAAGGGSRFNADDPDALLGAKLFEVVRGKPLVSWAIAPTLDVGFDDVVVVFGAADLSDFMPASVTSLHNVDWELGQATSLRCGIEWCAARGHQSVVIGLGDTPGLTTTAWREVARAPEGPIVFATYGGRRAHPVRLDADVWPLLPRTGDEGARSVARQYPELVREVACRGEPTDIDTPEDLRRWSATHGFE